MALEKTVQSLQAKINGTAGAGLNQIAAIVLTVDAKLLSRNLGDFRKVPGLAVEDWTAA